MSVATQLINDVVNTVLGTINPFRTRPTHDTCSGKPKVVKMKSGEGNKAWYRVRCPTCGETWTGNATDVPRAKI